MEDDFDDFQDFQIAQKSTNDSTQGQSDSCRHRSIYEGEFFDETIASDVDVVHRQVEFLKPFVDVHCHDKLSVSLYSFQEKSEFYVDVMEYLFGYFQEKQSDTLFSERLRQLFSNFSMDLVKERDNPQTFEDNCAHSLLDTLLKEILQEQDMSSNSLLMQGSCSFNADTYEGKLKQLCELIHEKQKEHEERLLKERVAKVERIPISSRHIRDVFLEKEKVKLHEEKKSVEENDRLRQAMEDLVHAIPNLSFMLSNRKPPPLKNNM